MNLQKNKNGITLIALIITIIVLLILAAVSISTLFGENGILTKATTASKSWEIGEFKEQVKLDVLAAQVNMQTSNPVIPLTLGNLSTALQEHVTSGKYDSVNYIENVSPSVTVIKGDKTAIIDEMFNILIEGETIAGEIVGPAPTDTTSPTATVGYSITSPTNQPVTATITSNENIGLPTGWTKVSDTVYTREYDINITENITIADLSGNTAIVEIKIENIDTTVPSGNASYSPSTATSGTVVVTITTNKAINTPAGWTSLTTTTFTKAYTANKNENISITDTIGNPGIVNVNVTNIVPILTLAEEKVIAPIPTTSATVTSIQLSTVPVPAGFYFVGGTVSTGVVISDVATDSGKGDTSTALTGNQFVWVPTNETARIKVTISYPTGITAVGAITKWMPGTVSLATMASRGTIFTGNTIECENGTYTVYVKASNGQEVIATQIIAGNQFSRSNFAGGMPSTSYYKDDLTDPLYQAFRTSVGKYGGFYIARYEASYGATGNPLSKVSTTNSEEIWANTTGRLWNWISQVDAITKSAAMYSSTSVTSCLPYGITWDSTLQWLIRTGPKTLTDIASDSTSWGNYYNSTFAYSKGTKALNTFTLIDTGDIGAGVRNKANNIYDLAGNLFEWTQEQSSTLRILRGGDYYDYGSSRPPAYRVDGAATYSYLSVGFRSQLYLK